VETTLLGILGIDIRHISIQAAERIITLRGAVASGSDKEN